MKQTEKLGLNLLETADLLSPKPLNENAEKVDAALGGMPEKILGRVMMASGIHVGDGRLSVTIQTAGFKPTLLLMKETHRRVYSGDKHLLSETSLMGESFESPGFVLWCGEDISVLYWYEDGTMTNPNGAEETAYRLASGPVRFTAADGSLTWSLSAGDMTKDIDHSPLVNNKAGVDYKWAAFGYEEKS